MPFLDWVNKNQAKETSRDVPYHLLHQEQTYGDAADNLLIQGDNLLALKALIPFYAGQVKCIYIDPPYNTQSAFEHYDDKLEHSQWLSMMYPRLVLLRELLAEDGSIWVSIDDREAHYLKVLLDEVFGRHNFVASVIWRKNYSPKSTAKHFSEDHDYIIVYGRNAERWVPNPMPRTEKQDKAYRNPDSDPRGNWKPSDLSARNFYSLGTYSVTSPSGRVIDGPPPGRYWTIAKEKFLEFDADNRIWWGKDGNNIPAFKRFLSEVKQGVVPQTFWPYEEVGHTQDAKKEIVKLFGSDVFGTPKPEQLMGRVLQIGSNPGDLVLDSFLGSGTTAAVAHKMGRRWIGIEMGDHARTHCIPRLQKVIDGEQGGISEAVGWKGGGGFRFYTLRETAFDAHGHINAAVRFATLAAYVWHLEVGEPGTQTFDSPLLGIHNGTAYYLLYNGILGDRRPAGGNVLTQPVLQHLQALAAHTGPKVIYGESSRLGPARLAAAGIIFKQIPYDIKMR
ncbi:MAG TPA: site-specific DNA-methyltransferase [Thiomonas arsenitoxydans]|jgi:adenine-specific DNA-methyltransferase|uniref:site-specific DNA-methyltransferase n=1 Tax=Thiomonas arsenitoxydans (strain DSM 22701 / CIP 110005 / 3As) TaxID=426114 RepID=UPI002B723AFC|nr:site-specific DNA-methyltransferase [Thiomonas arsenitoxydans]HML83192.1 site-specific DNA-methyltransferase [Thiomonas arsenitoxydans]